MGNTLPEALIFDIGNVLIFAFALERAGVQSHQAWYVDDRSDFVDVAEKLGMRGIPYRNASELASALGIA